MPAAPIVGAVIAIAAAAEIVTPVAIGLAVIATAGAVASTVGTITGDKTLSMVGNIMGAVGSLGGIANGLGFFGAEAAGALGSGGVGVTNAAGGAAAEIAPTAVDTATATGGLNAYTPEFLQGFDSAYSASGSVEGALASANTAAAATGGSAAPSTSIIETLTGQVRDLTVASAEPPTPIQSSDFMAPAATNTAVSPEGLNPSADLAVDPSKGLLSQPLAEQPPPVQPSEFGDPAAQATPMVEAPSVTPTDYMNANVDTQGGLIQQNAAANYADGTSFDGSQMAQGEDIYGSSPAGEGGVRADNAVQVPPPPNQASTYGDAWSSGTPNVPAQADTYGGAWDTGATGTPRAGQSPINGQTGFENAGQPPGQPAPQPTAAQTPPAGDTGYTNMAMKPGVSRQGDYGPGWTSGTSGSKSDGSLWSDFLSFAKDNKTLVLGGMMSLGSFMSGALSPKTPAEVEALNAQAERNRAAAQLEYTQNQLMQRRLNNLGQPLPVARRGGLVNMAVTGRPA